MLIPKFSIAISIDNQEVTIDQAQETLKNYGRALQEIAYSQMVRLYSLAIKLCEDFDRHYGKNAPAIFIGTILCNFGEGCDGCTNDDCPARVLAHEDYFQKWDKAYNGK